MKNLIITISGSSSSDPKNEMELSYLYPTIRYFNKDSDILDINLEYFLRTNFEKFFSLSTFAFGLVAGSLFFKSLNKVYDIGSDGVRYCSSKQLRENIKQKIIQKIKKEKSEEKYKSIIIISHSLGTVVAEEVFPHIRRIFDRQEKFMHLAYNPPAFSSIPIIRNKVIEVLNNIDYQGFTSYTTQMWKSIYYWNKKDIICNIKNKDKVLNKLINLSPFMEELDVNTHDFLENFQASLKQHPMIKKL